MSKEQKKARRKNSKQKGSSFERQICKELSLWWSDGEDPDVFWRSPGSGSWARGKGSEAPGWGDVVALKPEGELFTSHVVVEIKRGYGDLDSISANSKETGKLVRFLKNLEHICLEEARKRFPVLIYKKDRSPTMICIPLELARIAEICPPAKMDMITVTLSFPVLEKTYVAMKWSDFTEWILPDTIRYALSQG